MVTPDRKVRKLMEEYQKTGNLSRAALRTDLDPKTARKYLKAGKLPSQMRVESIRGERVRIPLSGTGGCVRIYWKTRQSWRGSFFSSSYASSILANIRKDNYGPSSVEFESGKR